MAAGWSAGYTDSLEEADEDLCPWCDDMSVELPVLSASSPPADEVSQGWWRRPGRSSRSWGRMRRQPRISSWHFGGHVAAEVYLGIADLLVFLEGDVALDHVVEEDAKRPDSERVALVSRASNPFRGGVYSGACEEIVLAGRIYFCVFLHV